jgi:hypothetical protein
MDRVPTVSWTVIDRADRAENENIGRFRRAGVVGH